MLLLTYDGKRERVVTLKNLEIAKKLEEELDKAKNNLVDTKTSLLKTQKEVEKLYAIKKIY